MVDCFSRREKSDHPAVVCVSAIVSTRLLMVFFNFCILGAVRTRGKRVTMRPRNDGQQFGKREISD